MRGKLITIEGIDGSGKGTQSRLIVDRLLEMSIPAKLYSFPSYDSTFFGKEVGSYLRGEFGTIDSVHPKLSSLLFAGDRFENKASITQDLDNGTTVVCDRYVDSNIAHQCAKLPEKERGQFSKWLEELEYGTFGMPRPDMVFLLSIPPETAREMVLRKSKRSYTDEKEDIHEASWDYLEKVFSIYSETALERQWNLIDCMRGDRILGIREINDLILGMISKQGR